MQPEKSLNEKLIEAAGGNNLSEVMVLWVLGADIQAENDKALRLAAENGHLPIVEYLVGKGADITAEDDFALQRSAGQGHLTVVQYLVEQGADLMADDGSALWRASMNGHMDVVKYLIEDLSFDNQEAKNSALLCAATEGHADVSIYLLEQNADYSGFLKPGYEACAEIERRYKSEQDARNTLEKQDREKQRRNHQTALRRFIRRKP